MSARILDATWLAERMDRIAHTPIDPVCFPGAETDLPKLQAYVGKVRLNLAALTGPKP